ncbi:MAG TPA: PIG-L family deacetylase [bacterium]|nr:PIG-L family deacetylase [bacterium]
MTQLFKILKCRKLIFALLVVFSLALGGYFINNRYFGSMPQAAIFFLNDIAAPKPDDKILVFSPHPDDETLAAGGYIYEAVKAGATVKIVLVTDGNKHNLKDLRYTEFKKSLELLGVPESNLVFLGYPDGRLKSYEEDEVASTFKREVDEFKPDTVICPAMEDTHSDHAFTGKTVDKVLGQLDYKPIIYRYLVHHPNFPQPKKFSADDYLLPPLAMVNFDKEWQRFLLSPEAIEQKTEAIFSYQSQLRVPFLRSLILSMVRKNELFSVGIDKEQE